jgi:hypothetical protein
LEERDIKLLWVKVQMKLEGDRMACGWAGRTREENWMLVARCGWKERVDSTLLQCRLLEIFLAQRWPGSSVFSLLPAAILLLSLSELTGARIPLHSL